MWETDKVIFVGYTCEHREVNVVYIITKIWKSIIFNNKTKSFYKNTNNIWSINVREHSNITQTMRDHMYIWSHMSFSSLLFIYDVFPSHTYLGQSFFSSSLLSVRLWDTLRFSLSFLFYFLVVIAQGEEKILHHLSPRVTSTRRRCIQASSPACLCFLCFSPLFSLCVCVSLCV
jgi:hypothetical protein